MRNKLKKIITEKRTPVDTTSPQIGPRKKKFLTQKKEIYLPITYYPNAKKEN